MQTFCASFVNSQFEKFGIVLLKMAKSQIG